jgi:hypothetical protein
VNFRKPANGEISRISDGGLNLFSTNSALAATDESDKMLRMLGRRLRLDARQRVIEFESGLVEKLVSLL